MAAPFLANLAVDVKHAIAARRESGSTGGINARIVAGGLGWTVADVVCSSGPLDRRFEEQHEQFTIAIVAAGSFQYRSAAGEGVMTPGSLMLGRPRQCYECGHEHAAGDRCISFWYAPDYFERLVASAGLPVAALKLPTARLPALRALSPIVARACAGVLEPACAHWEEIGVELAVRAAGLATGVTPVTRPSSPSALARVTRVVRRIETAPNEDLALQTLAAEARLSPFHFLRVFEQLTGVTPHRYVSSSRLRLAAHRLALERDRVLDIALDCGFGDVSTFNRAFRAEFGCSPRAYRRRIRAGSPPVRSC